MYVPLYCQALEVPVHASFLLAPNQPSPTSGNHDEDHPPVCGASASD